MKKTLLLLLSVALLAACDKENSNHTIFFSYPAGAYGVAYADQETDSVVIVTFDSYQASTDVDWITIDPDLEYMKIQNSYWYMWEIPIPLTFDANTTGETRMGIISIHNFGDGWDRTVQTLFLQMGWLNITHPAPTYQYYTVQNSDTIPANYPMTATFELTDTATQVRDSLTFIAYDDWTVTCKSDFVKLENATGSAGECKVDITLVDANETAAERTAELILTSRGVSSTIKLTQTPEPEEEEE